MICEGFFLITFQDRNGSLIYPHCISTKASFGYSFRNYIQLSTCLSIYFHYPHLPICNAIYPSLLSLVHPDPAASRSSHGSRASKSAQ